MRDRRFLGACGVVALVAACGGSAFTSDPGQGGSNAGGNSGSGGQTTDGGKGSAVGGVASDGGASGRTSGGATGDGGASDRGGTPAFGGANSGGGASPGGQGGATNSGGKGGTTAGGKGGAANSGGATNSGGKGGAANSGGATSSGGKGGAANSGGKGGGGGKGGAAGADGICRNDADCRISSDCCDCFAAAPGEATMICRLLCIQSACQAAGIEADEVSCVAGRCVIARSCTPGGVICDAVPPSCPAGSLPSVNGGCWGPCLQVGECSDVPSCKACSDAGLTCVTDETQLGPRYHCVSTPPACEKNPTCACMSVCRSPYMCAAPESTELSCTCPVC